ncbi:transglycosylase domain-containing protein [Pyxidicoccus parkwayensis]|uniref:Transglycosylase domain-containing protein n=1 Tax=Pyxidicoccus parkwayensis TaxID=2813578 RepID=A0ABX7NQA6_9BACT|nr:transglycosylase domain-containing protein [Pyxidicoccus parkwaysis]QSQ20559.1 transglycosylase domain-containing protein [Pyxidicoccus parkwaysis]
MKSLLWIVLFLLGLAGVVIPLTYLYTASRLPPLESEFDVQKQLKHSIEGERMSLRAGQYEKNPRPVTFQPPDFSRLPKDLVALYIRHLGCPRYFQTPREDGPAWAWRLFAGVTVGTVPPGDGGCERILAMRLAGRLNIEGPLPQTVAAHRLHSFMQKDQLIVYDLSTAYFERGIVGVEDAAYSLFKRELGDLQLAELAELQLALPPFGYYDDLKQCRNPTVIRQNRDMLLEDLAGWKLVSEDRARNAMAQPVSCTRSL